MLSVVEKTPLSVDAAPVLKVEGLKAYYQMNYFGVRREVRAVDDVTLTIKRNEIYGIAGESSSGKSSLIKTIAGAITPPLRVVEGSVKFDFGGKVLDVYGEPERMKKARWQHLSYIMQGSMNVLNPVRKVKHAFHDFAFEHMGLSERAFRERVEKHLQRIGLDPRVLESFPHQLSGGMRQRLTIALATVCEPDFIIADEPTTALDVLVQQDVLALIKDIQRRMGASIIFVTHDMTVHAAIADRIGIVYAGRLVEEGPTLDVFRQPQHPYTAHLIASLPRLGDKTRRSALPGKPPNLAEPPSGCRFHPRCPLAIDKCKTDNPPLENRLSGRVACWRAGEVAAA
ncbi:MULTISPECIES: ABC transporter ATP-binding protein [unclassified Devosia]|uniref:ABC transporter ATP-binding protein n=1 Tax=unclassified Devosia TaxID=196773 RepID=UPI000713D510|nr:MULTISPECIES: ABC transporter ATP-binding protein [unclassified Devosia]KQN71499.1 ABC transporter [Devosia sp. Leaf64]KQT45779.1 ABC transporter [Devosia sp. Leaf420]